jgi:TolA-binding protein
MLGEEPAGPLPDEGPLTRRASATARTSIGVLAVGLFLGGCATGADVAGLATQDEVLKLRTDVTSLQRSVQQARAQTETLSGQLASRPTAAPAVDSTRQLEAIHQRLDAVTSTLTALNKRIDELSGRLDALGRQVRASTIRPGPGLISPPVTTPAPPVAAVPTAPPASPAPPPPATAAPARAAPATAAPVTASPVPATAEPVSPAPSTAAPARPAPAQATPASPPAASPPPPRANLGALAPQDLYQAAYIDFSKGNYALSIDGFREFLRRHPDHAQASNAQYWIGEGYVALAQQHANAGQSDRATEALQRAVQEFRKVVANYPRSERAPTALYKEALTLMDLKQPALAQARLQYLVDNFPQAEEIPLARERLAALRK